MIIKCIAVLMAWAMLPALLYPDSGFYFDDPAPKNQGPAPLYDSESDPTFPGYAPEKKSPTPNATKKVKKEEVDAYSFGALSQKMRRKEPTINEENLPQTSVSEIEKKLEKSKKGGLTFSSLSTQIRKPTPKEPTKNATSGPETSQSETPATLPNTPETSPQKTNPTPPLNGTPAQRLL